MQLSNIQYAEIAGYRITEQIGAGGMGQVYKAYNAKFHRLAAVKILHHKEFADRFKNEAYIQSSICHPNIAQLYAFDYFEGMPCIIMEYVEGKPLDAYIGQKVRLSNEETENMLRQIVPTLIYLHQKGIIHRDIKPQNFKIQPDGTVKMLDFGIAKNRYTPSLTQHGFVVGTTEYMAPEQFKGQVSIQSDIWSLGVMIYQMVTSYLPIETSHPISLHSKITSGNFTDPKILVPDISKTLCTIIDKSLQIHPENRITAEGIEAILNSKRKERIPGFSPINSLPKVNRRKLLYAGGGFLLAIVLALTLLTNLPGKETPTTSKKLKTNISVSGTENAFIILSDGTRKPIPLDLYGVDGEIIEFTLGAEGHEEKQVKIEISPRRESYSYRLEKIKY